MKEEIAISYKQASLASEVPYSTESPKSSLTEISLYANIKKVHNPAKPEMSLRIDYEQVRILSASKVKL